jgi:hypothetical protein
MRAFGRDRGDSHPHQGATRGLDASGLAPKPPKHSLCSAARAVIIQTGRNPPSPHPGVTRERTDIPTNAAPTCDSSQTFRASVKTGTRTRNEGDRAKSPIGPVCGVAQRQPPPNGNGARSARSSRHRPFPWRNGRPGSRGDGVESDKQEQRSAAGRALAGAGRKSDDEPAFRRSRLLTRGKCAARARRGHGMTAREPAGTHVPSTTTISHTARFRFCVGRDSADGVSEGTSSRSSSPGHDRAGRVRDQG